MRTLVVLLLVSLALAGLIGIAHDRKLTASFQSIAPNASEPEVRFSLGNPSQTAPTCAAYGTEQSTHCDHVLVYRSAFSFITHKHWLVFIDPAGRATATSMQVEP